MTARQSYHLTFSRFSPSLSVKSFTASEAANTAYRVENHRHLYRFLPAAVFLPQPARSV